MSASMVEEAPMKQGIVTILNSDSERRTKSSAASIRRTLSADMSSKKWLSQNGLLSPTKKTAPSADQVCMNLLPGQDDIWRSIQEKKKSDEMQKPPVWGSILAKDNHKNDDNSSPVYVHPLVRRSVSCLSEKSLEICTESLGSETGSDSCFSSYASSEVSSDGDEDRQRVVEDQLKGEEYSNPFEDLHVVKYKNSPVRPFPPPMPSIAGGDGAASLHMQSRRENGRLVLEAVKVPARNYFRASRVDGRLVLTLIRGQEAAAQEGKRGEEFEKVFDNMEEFEEDNREEEKDADDDGGGDDDEEEEEEAAEEEEENFALEQNNARSLPSGGGVLSVHKSGLLMKKIIAYNKNPNWSNKKVNAEAEEEEEVKIPQSLPPKPPVAPPATASVNAYEYFWRNKTTASGGGFITSAQPTNLKNISNGTTKAYANQDLVLMRGNKGEFYLKGCKEPRRSLFWEPYCIATS